MNSEHTFNYVKDKVDIFDVVSMYTHPSIPLVKDELTGCYKGFCPICDVNKETDICEKLFSPDMEITVIKNRKGEEASIPRNERFQTSPKKNIFYCFECKRGGDVITFFAAVSKVSAKDAVNELIKLYNLEVSPIE